MFLGCVPAPRHPRTATLAPLARVSRALRPPTIGDRYGSSARGGGRSRWFRRLARDLEVEPFNRTRDVRSLKLNPGNAENRSRSLTNVKDPPHPVTAYTLPDTPCRSPPGSPPPYQ